MRNMGLKITQFYERRGILGILTPISILLNHGTHSLKTGPEAGQYFHVRPPIGLYKWAIKHKRNRKTTEKQARSNPYCPILGPCPTLVTIASGNFL